LNGAKGVGEDVQLPTWRLVSQDRCQAEFKFYSERTDEAVPKWRTNSLAFCGD